MNEKKLAAAMAAVYTVIRTGEEAAAAATAFAPSIPESALPLQPVGMETARYAGAWALSGRQAQMQAGSMMQLRMFK